MLLGVVQHDRAGPPAVCEDFFFLTPLHKIIEGMYIKERARV